MIGFKAGDFDVDNCLHEGRQRIFEYHELETLPERNHQWGAISKSVNAIKPITMEKMATKRTETRKIYFTAFLDYGAKPVKTHLETLKSENPTLYIALPIFSRYFAVQLLFVSIAGKWFGRAEVPLI